MKYYPVIANNGAEIWCFKTVDNLNELCTVIGINLREQTSRENTELKENGNCLILCLIFYFFW